MYFLRARYLNTQTGRFHTMDTYEGRNSDPLTLHKYVYTHGNPVMGIDPSGRLTLVETMAVGVSVGILTKLAVVSYRVFYKNEVLSTFDILMEIAEGAGYGALGGFVATQMAPVILSSNLWGSFGGTVVTATLSAAAVQQFKEFVDFFVLGKPSTFIDRSGRIVKATEGGLITGGISATVFKVLPTPSFKDPVKDVEVDFRGGVNVFNDYGSFGTAYWQSVNSASSAATVSVGVVEGLIGEAIGEELKKID